MRFNFSQKATEDTSPATAAAAAGGLPANETNAPKGTNLTSHPIAALNITSTSILADHQQAADISPSPGSAPANPDEASRKATKQRSARPHPEQRLAELMGQNPLTWTCKDVGDWLDGFGLGKYRTKFIHHAVSGPLLPKLTDQILKEELGVRSLGHRDAIIRAIAALLDAWSKESEEESEAGASTPGASPGSANGGGASLKPGVLPPLPTIPGIDLLKAQEKRARLAHELEKAEARAAQRTAAAQQALRTVELAEKEVQRLKTALKEVDYIVGGDGSPGKLGGKPQSGAAKRQGAPSASSFMERLQADLQSRKQKTKQWGSSGKGQSDGKVNKGQGSGDSNLESCLDFLRSVCKEKDIEYPESLRVPQKEDENEAKLTAKLDELADKLAGEVGMQEADTEAVKGTEGPLKKAQKLCSAVRKGLFLQRLDKDLAAREDRKKELLAQEETKRLAAAKAAEEKDLKEANDTFSELGWRIQELQGTSGLDDLLGALLRRAKAVQAAKAANRAVDWESHREDGLLALASSVQGPADILPLPAEATTGTGLPTDATAALSSVDPLAASGVGQSSAIAGTAGALPASGPPVLLEAVNLLADCRADELERLEGATGNKKLSSTFRALRAQQFLRAAKEKLEAKVAKAAEAEAARQPVRKVLPKEAGEAFLQRLVEDAEKRARNREELQAKALEEEKAKIAASIPKGKASAPAAAS